MGHTRQPTLCLWQQTQTMSHIVKECPLTLKFPGGLQALHSANEDSIIWRRQLSIR